MPRPKLSPQITAQIIEYIKQHDLPRDHHLAGQALADEFRVSRAPVAAALRQLEHMKIVRSEPNRGYFLLKSAHELGRSRSIKLSAKDGEDKLYFTLAADRLSGKLPERVSEAELMRIYDLPRSRVLKLLHRIADEGWIERLHGNGWAFRPVLTSRSAYEEGYQFRAAIESQALLVPTFKVDRRAFLLARDEQQDILGGAYKTLSRDQLFRSNSEFHEMLVAWSRNDFFLESLRRVNSLRRLVEYKITVDRSRLPVQCQEHLRILQLIDAGDLRSASDFLRVHILGASAIKSPQIA